jgi:Flp pilus assembly pilin Flp
MEWEKMSLKKGQGFVEYAMLIIIVSAAIIAMTLYLIRSVNARLKQTQDELNYYGGNAGK